MAFETFKKQRIKPSDKPQVSIRKKGSIALNAAAFDALSQPEAVELLFDRENELIGIKKVDPELQHAYAIHASSRSSMATFAGTAFMKYYGIEVDGTKRLNASMQDGILVVDLKGTDNGADANYASAPAEHEVDTLL